MNKNFTLVYHKKNWGALFNSLNYSIVKDSSADLGVNSKIVQDSLVCLSIFWYFWEKIKKHNFLYSEHLRQNSPKVNQNYYWLWVFFGLSIFNCQIRITVLNYTVV